MAALDQRKLGLIAEIECAFDGVSRGGGVTWHEAWATAEFRTPEECAVDRKLDAEQRWQDVPDRVLKEGIIAFAFLDASGMRYYLPACFSWFLRHIDQPDIDFVKDGLRFFIAHLKPNMQDLHEERSQSRFRELDPAQSKVIAHFLVYAAEREAEIYEKYQANDSFENDAVLLRRIEVARQGGEHFASKYVGVENLAQNALDLFWWQFL